MQTRERTQNTHKNQRGFAATSVAAADRESQRTVVSSELELFEASLAAKAPHRSVTAGATAPSVMAGGRGGDANGGGGRGDVVTRRLRAQAPYQDGRSLLTHALRVQRAAAWLAECPAHTLRTLQRRVLCSSEAAFVGFGGVPQCMRPYLAQLPFTDAIKAAIESSDGEEAEAELEVPPLEPMSFLDFVTTLLVVDPAATDGTGDVLVDARVTRAKSKGSGRKPLQDEGLAAAAEPAATLSRTYLRTVLPARAAANPSRVPPASTTLATAVYDLRSVESSLVYTVDKVIDPLPPTASPGEIEGSLRRLEVCEDTAKEATAPARAAVLLELAHWSSFFVGCFDETRSGVCEDGFSVLCSVLLACGAKGAAESDRTPEATADKAVRTMQERETGGRAHDHTCSACRHRHRAEEFACHHAVYTQTAARCRGCGDEEDEGAGTRFFLGTAAVVLWAQAFLHHYRCGSGTDTDSLPPAEVFLLRDWLLQQSRSEAGCLQRQATGGGVDGASSSTLRLAKTCASNSPTLEIGFTQARVAGAAAAMTEWVQQGIEQGHALTSPELLRLLREMLPVSVYYATFFC